METALQVSGGRDSLACLHLMRERWDSILVTWLNTGAAFPETEKQMAEIAATVPHFLEVRTDVLADIDARGWPVDVLPVAHTELGAELTSTPGIRLRPWFECCAANFWRPLHAAMVERGIKRIIRGQRTAEKYKSVVRSGCVQDGIEYVFPLENWTASDVNAYLAENGIALPSYYDEVSSSLDCWNCTAYLDAKAPQIAYLARHHSEKHALVSARLREIGEAIGAALQPLARSLM